MPMRNPIRAFFSMLKRGERKLLVAWVRYARANRKSNALPVLLFCLLFVDAFILIVPSMLLVAISITIQPRRWFLFALIFTAAVLCNNSVTYLIGRLVPAEIILSAVNFFGISTLWDGAMDAIINHGKYATFLGGFLPLPTQLITMIIGLADGQQLVISNADRTSFFEALGFGALGHLIKITGFAGFIRFGWMRIERRVEKANPTVFGSS